MHRETENRRVQMIYHLSPFHMHICILSACQVPDKLVVYPSKISSLVELLREWVMSISKQDLSFSWWEHFWRFPSFHNDGLSRTCYVDTYMCFSAWMSLFRCRCFSALFVLFQAPNLHPTEILSLHPLTRPHAFCPCLYREPEQGIGVPTTLKHMWRLLKMENCLSRRVKSVSLPLPLGMF